MHTPVWNGCNTGKQSSPTTTGGGPVLRYISTRARQSSGCRSRPSRVSAIFPVESLPPSFHNACRAMLRAMQPSSAQRGKLRREKERAQRGKERARGWRKEGTANGRAGIRVFRYDRNLNAWNRGHPDQPDERENTGTRIGGEKGEFLSSNDFSILRFSTRFPIPFYPPKIRFQRYGFFYSRGLTSPFRLVEPLIAQAK